MSWDDLGYDDPEYERPPDEYEVSAREKLREFFERNDSNVYFANQLAVQNETEYFHWITHRAVSELIQEGLLHTESRDLATGTRIKLVWHRKHRYYKRDAKRVVELVDEYGSPNMCAAIGLHGEQMILAAFAKRQFLMHSHGTRHYGEREWTTSNQNLDFIFERDGMAYGIEVKNTLSYLDEQEFDAKIQLCEHLGITPVFAVRMIPKTWMKKLIDRGGYGMILKYQLYPWTHAELAKRVAKELGLPVDAPRALADGTMDRFMKWHGKKL
jgi:hypothetical protein